MIGRFVERSFNDDDRLGARKQYRGVVSDYIAEDSLYVVKYDAGDREDYSSDELDLDII